MKITKRKDGKISIILSAEETFTIAEIGEYAHETGYFLDKMRDYDEKRINRKFFIELKDAL